MGTMARIRRLGATPPPPWIGLLAAAASVAAATAIIFPLERIAPPASLSVVYLPGVLLISAYWGLPLGLLTSLISAAAFNFFHLPPTGKFTIANSGNWVALTAFTLVAVVVSTVAEVARSRTVEAERRRAEADLVASLARELLSGTRTEAALGQTARRLATALTMPSASIVLGASEGGPRQLAVPLADTGGRQIATMLVPATVASEILERIRSQAAPALAALVAIALHRDAVQAEAVETAALRRSDELKTALLRSVSHDLRSPLTSIVAAGHALGMPSISDEEREELSAAVVEEGARLSTLIDKLLDLSRLQAGRAEPHAELMWIEDVILAARDRLPAGGGRIDVKLDPDLPPVVGDAAQLEQVFVNLLENARRYSREMPVSVHAHRVGSRVVIRVVDHGPGITPADRERIFEPFYRGSQPDAPPWKGSGLGLAIARGFVEANHGSISVESLPGQGTSFVVELPVPRASEVGTT